MSTEIPDFLTQDRVEPSTKIVFPATYEGSTGQLQLGSVGVRKRWLLSVYAFGLYYDMNGASEELQRWNTYDMDELASNLSFYYALIGSKFEKGIRMVLARSVKGSDLQTAFEESLRPRVQRYAAQYSHGHKQANKRFHFVPSFPKRFTNLIHG
jgi:hypothetical protein